MSELTSCNYCTLETMKQRAKERGVKVVLEQTRMGDSLDYWTSARYSDEQEPSAYFMQLTAHCAC